MVELSEKVKGIKEKITSSSSSIFFKRVPKKTYDIFMKMAEEDFCGDFGMLLKHLLDFYLGLIPSGIEHLEAAVEHLDNRMTVLEQAVAKKPEDKPRTNLLGEQIGRGK